MVLKWRERMSKELGERVKGVDRRGVGGVGGGGWLK